MRTLWRLSQAWWLSVSAASRCWRRSCSFSLAWFYQPASFGFLGGILAAIAAMPGPLVFIFLLAKGLRGKAFTKEASLYLVVSAGLLAILLTASRQFSWLDVSVSAAALLPVVLGMFAGQHMLDKIAPETFEKLVLI